MKQQYALTLAIVVLFVIIPLARESSSAGYIGALDSNLGSSLTGKEIPEAVVTTTRVHDCERREPYLLYQPTTVVRPNEDFSIEIFVDFSDCPKSIRTYYVDFNGNGIFEVSGEVDRDSFSVEGRLEREGSHPLRGKVQDAYGTTHFLIDVYVTIEAITSEEARRKTYPGLYKEGFDEEGVYILGDGIRNRRVVLFLGSSEERFWIDINLAYHVLKEKYQFTDEEIILLTPDSDVPASLTDFDVLWIDGVSDTTTIQDTFSDLSNELDGDDFLFLAYDGHGGGYYGPRTRRPYWNALVPNSVYEGPIEESESDDPDYREDQFQTEFIPSGRVDCLKYDGVSKGLDKFLPCFYYRVTVGIYVDNSYYRFKLMSHFQDLPLIDGSTVSDDDIFIEKIISYAECDLNRNTIIEANEIDLCDWDDDGITLFTDWPTGEFDEDDWFDRYELEQSYHPYGQINGQYYCFVDKNLDDTLEMVGFETDSDPLYLDCLSQQADPADLNPSASDKNNDGYSDYLDINLDNDLHDYLSFDETLSFANDDEVANLFSMISPETTKLFLTQSCFGGGFLRDLSDQHIISMSASEEDDTSSGNYFIRHVFMALNKGCELFGSSPTYPGYDCDLGFWDKIEEGLDLDEDGLVSITEAFRRSVEKGKDFDLDETDSPMFDDNADLEESYGYSLTFIHELSSPYCIGHKVPEGIWGDSTFFDEEFFGNVNQVSCYDFDRPLNFSSFSKIIHQGQYHFDEDATVDHVCDGRIAKRFVSGCSIHLPLMMR